MVVSPENGNMMGGTLVNVTGPCFEESYRVMCGFDAMNVEAKVISKNVAVCVMPRVTYTGYTDVTLSINGGPYLWKAKFFVGMCA